MTGKPLFDKILVGLNLATLLGGLGLFVYTNMIYKRPLPDEAAELEDLKNSAKKGTEVPPLKLDKMTINLHSETARLRFLDIEAHLLPFKEDEVKILETKKTEILDAIMEVASNMSPEDLNSISGKILLENRLKNRINNLLGDQIVREIFFSSFVVQ
jgi:flagellar FliL protein